MKKPTIDLPMEFVREAIPSLARDIIASHEARKNRERASGYQEPFAPEFVSQMSALFCILASLDIPTAAALFRNIASTGRVVFDPAMVTGWGEYHDLVHDYVIAAPSEDYVASCDRIAAEWGMPA